MKIKTIYFNREKESYSAMFTDLNGGNDIEIKMPTEMAEDLIKNFKIEKYDTPDFIHYEL